ncbi:MAG: SGNH/GDSL hydrolase family protein [Phycisphaerales bacterium]|nr:SGNH/GDSL hydrolase family protein [Phycisphaerales bacterium]
MNRLALMGAGLMIVVGCIAVATPKPAAVKLQPGELAPIAEKTWHVLRSGLDRSYKKFSAGGMARVVFLGGSITQNPGWQNKVAAYLKARFPKTKFDIINAGIGSTGSTPGAFRFENDALKNGKIDLLFEEAAVNDNHNGRTQTERVRGMEGIVRHAYTANPECDVVVMHFAEPGKTASYAKGKTPDVIVAHDKVTAHYNVPTLNLAREVFDRLEAKQFDWAKDFRNLHPSPFGQTLYYHAIRRMLEDAWGTPEAPKPVPANIASRPLPKTMLDPQSYTKGKFVPLSASTKLNGFTIVPKWKAPRGGKHRSGFVDVPFLSATKPGSSFSLEFTGRAIGFFMVCGPDAGIIEYRIDGGEWKSRNSFTRWSRGLNIPWALILDADLKAGKHVLDVRLSAKKGKQSKGTALHIRNFLVNG